jgi:hypothetical protein
MIVFVISLVLLAIIFITCTLIAFIYGSGKWLGRCLIGFNVSIFAALLSLVYMFIKQ